MSFKKIWITISAVTIAFIIGVLVGYFVGKGQAKSKYEADRNSHTQQHYLVLKAHPQE